MRVNLELLTDDELIASLKSLVGDERRIVAAVLRHLSEFDRRRLAAGRGFPSLFDYCVLELKYAQGEAARRIQSARAAAKYPVLYRAVERGFISLTTVSILAPHLKWDNYRKLIRDAKGLSTREVEALVASLTPVPAAPPERIRFLTVAAPPAAPEREADDLFSAPMASPAEAEKPAPSQGPEPPAVEDRPAIAERPETGATVVSAEPAARTAPAGLAAAVPGVETPPPPVRRVHFSFTGDEALLRDYERAKELSRHKWPAGKMEDVFAGALRVLLDKIDPDRRRRRKERARRIAAGARSRNIRRAVKDEVWDRDGGRCSYAAPGGRVCGARAGLEFDHVRPWALGGGSGDAGNVRLLCRTHNDLEARRAFGGAFVDAAAARRRDGLRRGVKI
jgi:5-methylcytosine-specific restriction endonuclease McrA